MIERWLESVFRTTAHCRYTLHLSPRGRSIESDYQIQIDPGLAFGTGTHETTKMMLTLMIKHLKDAERTQVLDLGAGSGILSIAGTFSVMRLEGSRSMVSRWKMHGPIFPLTACNMSNSALAP